MNPLRRAGKFVGSMTALAKEIGQPTATVWAWVYRNSVPPEYCTAIERATSGQVSRRDLRPTDWGDIWPELIDTEHPWPPVAADPSTQEAA